MGGTTFSFAIMKQMPSLEIGNSKQIRNLSGQGHKLLRRDTPQKWKQQRPLMNASSQSIASPSLAILSESIASPSLVILSESIASPPLAL